MPWTNNPDADAEIDRIIEDRLVSIDKAVSRLGYPSLSPDELRRVAAFAVRETRQAIAQQRGQGPMPQTPPLPPGVHLPPGATIADFAEGGLINDASGQASAAIRRQLGIPEPMLRRTP